MEVDEDEKYRCEVTCGRHVDDTAEDVGLSVCFHTHGEMNTIYFIIVNVQISEAVSHNDAGNRRTER